MACSTRSGHSRRPDRNHGKGSSALLGYIRIVPDVHPALDHLNRLICCWKFVCCCTFSNLNQFIQFLSKGTSVHLKSKFGKGYTLKITLAASYDADNIKRIIMEATEREVEEEATTHLTFTFHPKDEDKLPNMFRALEQEQQSLGIEDLQLSMSTLEDVFLDVIKKAEAEEGISRMVTVMLPSGNTIQVAAGQEGPIQTTEGPVTVTWGLDDEGTMTAVNVAADSAKTQAMSVTVPEGLSGGSSVSIETPQGTIATVTIPEGLNGGDIFVAQVPLGKTDTPTGPQDSQAQASGDDCTRGTGLPLHSITDEVS